MTITEYVAKLEALRVEHGDLEVFEPSKFSGVLGAVRPVRGPYIEDMAILSRRESTVRTWGRSYDSEDKKGDAVVVLG